MIRLHEQPNGSTVVTLDNLDDWETFASDNHDALSDAYGCVGAAYQLIDRGGLKMGGGAGVAIDVVFWDDFADLLMDRRRKEPTP